MTDKRAVLDDRAPVLSIGKRLVGEAPLVAEDEFLPSLVAHDDDDDPAARDPSVARAAYEALDYRHAEAVLLARAHRRESLPLDLVADAVRCAESVGLPMLLVAAAEGDRSAMLFDLLERRVFANGLIGLRLRACAVHVAWVRRTSDAIRERLALHARLAAYDGGNFVDRATLQIIADIATEIGEPQLAAAMPRDESQYEYELTMAQVGATADRETALDLLDRFSRPLAQIRAQMARELAQDGGSAGRIGRNDPCLCGSRKKYKQCHGRSIDHRPRAQLSAQQISRADIRLHVIANLDLRRVETRALLAVLERFVIEREWTYAERVLAEAKLRPAKARTDFYGVFAMNALFCGRFDLVLKNLRDVSDPESAVPNANYLLGAKLGLREPDALDLLFAKADEAARDPSGHLAVGLANVIENVAPGLGLLIGRAGAIGDTPEHTRVLIAILQRLRVKLGMPISDPIEKVHGDARQRRLDESEREQLRQQVEALRSKLTAELEEMRGTLAHTRTTLKEREQTVRDLEAKLIDARTARATSPDVPAEPAEVRALKAKIDDLQAMIRERNAENVELRRQVDSAARDKAKPPR